MSETHQNMAAVIHQIFSKPPGIQCSSADAEKIVEIKSWLAAIVNGQLQITDTKALPNAIE